MGRRGFSCREMSSSLLANSWGQHIRDRHFIIRSECTYSRNKVLLDNRISRCVPKDRLVVGIHLHAEMRFPVSFNKSHQALPRIEAGPTVRQNRVKAHHEFVQLQRLQRLNPSSLGESPSSSPSVDNEESLVGFIEPSGRLSRAFRTCTHRLNWAIGNATIVFHTPTASSRPYISQYKKMGTDGKRTYVNMDLHN